MKAAVLEQFRKPLVIHSDWPDPIPNSTDILVRVKALGICRSDWHNWMGDFDWLGFEFNLPQVMGHEFSGIVEEAGTEVKKFKKGDRVLLPCITACYTCDNCRAGFLGQCLTLADTLGVRYPGGYGELAPVPLADLNALHLPDSISFEAAASLGCRVMTAFGGVVDRGQTRAGDRIAIHGCGGVGLSAIQVAVAIGAIVVAIDIDDEKLAFAKELGATYTVNAQNGDVPSAVADLTGGGVDVSIDALGIETTCRNSILSLRSRGRHVQIGLTTKKEGGQVSVPLDLITLKELAIVGSAGMSPARFPALVRMVESGLLKPDRLIKRAVPIEEASDVIEQMGRFATLGMTVVNRWW